MEKEKSKIFKIILSLVLLIIILLFLHIVRIHTIFSNIISIGENMSNTSNYSFISCHSGLEIEHYYLNGKNVLIYNGDTKAITWYDEDSKEMINLTPDELTATISSSDFILENELPMPMIENTFIQNLFTFITSGNINGEECYIIHSNNGTTKYVSKDTGILLKLIDGDNIIEYKNVTLNELTEQDVERPDLNGYEITTTN